MTPEEITLDGLAVMRFSPEHATASVVIVHGTMDRASSFRRVLRHLPDLELILYDRRGYARSRDGGLSVGLDAQLEDLRSVAALATRGTPVLVGHSLGGLLSLHAAARWPFEFGALLAWEPPMPWFDWYVGAVGDAANRMSDAASAGDVAEIFMRGMIGDRLWERLPAAMKAERRSEGTALVTDLHLSRDPSGQVDLSAIAVPTIAGCGGKSPARFGRTARAVMEGVPDAMLIEVADSDHSVHLAHPAEMAALIEATVARAR